jgi:hypothetical protein
MISILLSIVCAALMAFYQEAWAGEKLLYAVIYKGSGYTAAKTDIYSVDVETGEKRPVFSDEKTPIVLRQHLYVFHFPVVGGCKLFSHAIDRSGQAPFPGNGSLYELYTDGSNLFRRIVPVLGGESLGDIFANSTGTRIGYINRMNRKQYLFIHDVATGNLHHRVDITDKFLDCFAASIGWLPGSEKLFFSLQTGDADATSKASYAKVGTYIMNESGGHLSKFAKLPLPKGFLSAEMERLIGILPTGEYVFEAAVRKRHVSPKESPFDFVLAKFKKDSQEVVDLSFSQSAQLYRGVTVIYRLSPSGKYLSAVTLPILSSAFSWDIWLKSVQTGEERNILSLPTEGLNGPFLGLIGWLD